MYLIGVDLGTTGCKSIISDGTGTVLGRAYIEYPLIVHSPREIEQDADLWWELCCRAVREAVAQSGIDPASAAGIAVSSQGISFVLTDEAGNTLGNAISWLDARAVRESEKISSRISREEIFQRTGKRVSGIYPLPKLMWVKANRPGVWATARKLCMAHDFLVLRMTGEHVTDHTLASGTMLYDLRRQDWCPRLLEAFGIEKQMLPKLSFSGKPAGLLQKEAAEKMGLPEGVTVAVGGQDQKVAAHFLRPGPSAATLSMGTAGALEFLTTEPVLDPDRLLPSFSYLYEGQWTLEGVVSTAGAALKWLRGTLFPDIGYQRLDEMCMRSEAGAKGCFFYPHLEGATSPHWRTGAKGTLHGLALGTTANDIVRAVIEGICYQLRENIAHFEQLSHPVSEIRVFGGGSASEIWCRILADITQKELAVYEASEAANLGAAMLAMEACGLPFDGFGREVLRRPRRYLPDPAQGPRYDKLYAEYTSVERALLHVSKG